MSLVPNKKTLSLYYLLGNCVYKMFPVYNINLKTKTFFPLKNNRTRYTKLAAETLKAR